MPYMVAVWTTHLTWGSYRPICDSVLMIGQSLVKLAPHEGEEKSGRGSHLEISQSPLGYRWEGGVGRLVFSYMCGCVHVWVCTMCICVHVCLGGSSEECMHTIIWNTHTTYTCTYTNITPRTTNLSSVHSQRQTIPHSLVSLPTLSALASVQ